MDGIVSTSGAVSYRLPAADRPGLDILFRSDQLQTGAKSIILFGNQSPNTLDEKTLIYRRDGHGHFHHLLDVPGGGSEPGESHMIHFDVG